MKYQWLGMVLVVACGRVALAEQPAGDPLHHLLISPDVLIHHRAEIGLTDEQVEQIRSRLEEAGPKTHEHQMRLNKAMGRLAKLLSADNIDEGAALKQLDEVLAIEKDLKHVHLRLMIQIRNGLTAQQRQAAAKAQRDLELREGPQQRLQAKLSRIEKEVQSRAEAGQPPFEAVGLMQKFPELMQAGQVQEAEALLDRVIHLLGLDQRGTERVPDKTGRPPNSPKTNSPAPHAKDRKSPQTSAAKLSPGELVAQVTALKQQDVAWRKIAWKTCLLDGLKASRERHKPIVLWIFIDRPIDDERC